MSNQLRQHIFTLLALLALCTFIYAFSSEQSTDAARQIDTTFHKLPHEADGYRVYREERGSKRELLLDTPSETRNVVATASISEEPGKNGDFGRVRFSPSRRYLEYAVYYWEGGSGYVYDIQDKKIVFTAPMGSGSFTTDEKFYYTCYYAAFDGSLDATVYRSSDFAPVAKVFKKYPDLIPDDTLWDWNMIRCYEDPQTRKIVYEFGTYDGLGGDDVTFDMIDRTQFQAARRFVFDPTSAQLTEQGV